MEAGGRIAAVGLGDIDYARSFRDQTGITFPLLVDEKRMAYNAADLKRATLLHLFPVSYTHLTLPTKA